MSVVERIKEIEAEMARTQKNKATAYHLGTLKAKLAKLRRELLTPKGGGGGSGEGMPSILLIILVGFDVAKTGVARIGFVGFPSVGKSTLMSKLTGTYSAVAEYEFTTLTTVPGMGILSLIVQVCSNTRVPSCKSSISLVSLRVPKMERGVANKSSPWQGHVL